jgi:hypothetical protein
MVDFLLKYADPLTAYWYAVLVFFLNNFEHTEMNKKYYHTVLQYFFGPNFGVWLLIVLHLAILWIMITLFSSIIERMQHY